MKNILLKNIENLVKELNSAIKDGVEIKLEKGEYHIYPDDLSHKTFKITNSMPEPHRIDAGIPSYEKNLAIRIEHKKNIVVDGGGSKIICHGIMIPFYVFESENITLKNFSVDYSEPTVFELAVLEITEKYYLFKIHPDSKYRIKEDGKIVFYGKNFECPRRLHYCQRWIPDGDLIRRQVLNPFNDETSRWEEISDHIVRCYYENSTPNPYCLYLGGDLQLRDGVRDHSGLFIDRSRNVKMEKVNMHFMHGLGIVAQCTDTLTLNRVNCVPDKARGRKISSFADCCQISSCRGDVRVYNCNFDGANDDAINVHGTYMKIVKSEGNTVVARYIQGDTYNYNIFEVGDTVEACDPEFMLMEDRATVVSAELINPYEIEIVFDKPADKFKVDFVVENISACPNVHIKGCTVRRIPTRGFLVSTRGKVLIEENEFYSLCRAAVLIANDAALWFETGPVLDVTIRNNKIFDQTAKPIFRIQPENKQYRENEFVHKNIVIENNTAVGKERVAWLYAKSTDNIVLRGNKADFVPLTNELDHCGRVSED